MDVAGTVFKTGLHNRKRNNVHCILLYVDLIEFLMTATKTNCMENKELSTGY